MDLKDARRLLGMSQTQLDDAAGVRRGTSADIEQGRNSRPAFVTVMRIVQALRKRGLEGITAEELFPIADDDAKAVNA